MENEEFLTSLISKLDSVGVEDEIRPENIHPLTLRTRERKELSELEVEFQKRLEAIKYDPRVPELVLRLANIHLKESNFGRAIILYEIALGLNSDLITGWIHMGLAYLLVDEAKDAISCFGSALAIDPENVDALTYLAQAELKLGNFESCLKNIEEALRIHPEYERALLVKGLYFES